MDWILILFLWTPGDPTPDGMILGGIESEALCWNRARQDTPRVKHIANGKQFQWECIKRESPAKKPPVEPSV